MDPHEVPVKSFQNSPKGELFLILTGDKTPLDDPFLSFLQKNKIPKSDAITIPSKLSYELFKALAVSGEVYLNDKKLLLDLYGRSI